MLPSGIMNSTCSSPMEYQDIMESCTCSRGPFWYSDKVKAFINKYILQALEFGWGSVKRRKKGNICMQSLVQLGASLPSPETGGWSRNLCYF